jgi:uncharacterized protein YkwD
MLVRLMDYVADAPPPLPGQTPQLPQLPRTAWVPPEPEPPPPPPPPSQETNASAFELRVLELVNIERANHGLAPLEWHNALGTVARNHSIDMANRLFIYHTCPSGITFDQRVQNANISFFMVGENVAGGQRTPEVVVSRWMESPGHRANILNPDFTHLGVGFHLGTDRVYPQVPPYFWTQKFIAL